MNNLAISFNDYKMPVKTDKIFLTDETHFLYSNPKDVNMPFLSDMFYLNFYFFECYISIGDIFILFSNIFLIVAVIDLIMLNIRKHREEKSK